MNLTSRQLQELIAELHEVNDQLAAAARPLDDLPDLSEAERDVVGGRLRACLARWQGTTERIRKALELPTTDAPGEPGSHAEIRA
jgi:hypothetical protein